MTLSLVELTPDNIDAACRVDVKPEQQTFVASVVDTLAQAYVHYGTAWARLMLDDDRVVGFVMGNFDPDSEIEAFRTSIWRLNIAADEQRRGYGRYAVEAFAAEARRRGGAAARRNTVLWKQGDGGPELLPADRIHADRRGIRRRDCRRVDALGVAATSVRLSRKMVGG